MKILIIGGNRFFGKRLARLMFEQGHQVTLLNRGTLDDGLGQNVRRLKCDREAKRPWPQQLHKVDGTWLSIKFAMITIPRKLTVRFFPVKLIAIYSPLLNQFIILAKI